MIRILGLAKLNPNPSTYTILLKFQCEIATTSLDDVRYVLWQHVICYFEVITSIILGIGPHCWTNLAFLK